MPRIIFAVEMDEQQLMLSALKAEAFDRIVDKYRELQDSGFYSKNWVELAEVIENELKEFSGSEDDETRG